MSKAFEKIKAGLDEAAVIAPYVAEIERLTKERDEAREQYAEANDANMRLAEARDAAIARAEAAENLLSAHMETCVTEQICIDKIAKDRDALRALVREAGEVLNVFLGGDEKVQVAIGGNPYHVDELLNEYRGTFARIAAATGDDNGQ